MFVSINGVDNVGKTTQIRLLPNDTQIVKSKGLNCRSWPQFESQEDSSRFWFEDHQTLQFTSDIFEAFKNRSNDCLNEFQVKPGNVNDCNLVILDRGLIMFEAVCMATAQIKDNLELTDAKLLIDKIRKEHFSDLVCEDLCIFLKHSDSVEESIKLTLNREKEVSDIYEKYQQNLHNCIILLLEENHLNINDKLCVINCDNLSIVEIQNKIRKLLTEFIQNQNNNLGQLFPNILPNLKTIVGFGGLSECGKSFSAQYLFEKYNFVRIKIIYFVENICDKLRITTERFYELEPLHQSELLLFEIDKFSRIHYYFPYLTIESLRNEHSTLHLKNLLGNKLQILYLSAPECIRRNRGNADDRINFNKKEDDKKKNGTENIEHFANIVFKNDQIKLSCLTEFLDSLANRIKNQEMSTMDQLDGKYISFLVDDFFVSAGGVLVNELAQKVAIIKKNKNGEYLLPKGTKEIGETIEETAVREVYEETGYLNQLSKRIQLLAIQVRPQVSGKIGQHKVIYWFRNELISEIKYNNTQMEDENFDCEWHSMEDASKLLNYEEDLNLIQSAFPERLTELPQTNDIRNILGNAKHKGSIRIMIYESQLRRISSFVIFDTIKSNVLLHIDDNNGAHLLIDSNGLPIDIKSSAIRPQPNEKPLAFQLISKFDEINFCFVLEWHKITIDCNIISENDNNLKWFPITEASEHLHDEEQKKIFLTAKTNL